MNASIPDKNHIHELKTRVAVGSLIGNRYQVQDLISRSANSIVCLVGDLEENGKKKALKLLPKGHFDQQSRRLFAREFQLLHQLEHPGIVRVYECGICPQSGEYQTMEYLSWPTLDRIPDKVTREQALEILYDLAEILNFVHNHRIAHYDLKPNNIFVDWEGLTLSGSLAQPRIKVGDFGLAGKRVPEALLERRGTLLYSAPEMFAPGKVGSVADIYSLGMIGYALLCRKNPYSSTDSASLLIQKRQWLPSPDDWSELHLSDSLVAVLTRCLNPDPAFRPQRASELLGELSKYVPQKASGHIQLDSTPFIGRSAEIKQLSSKLYEVESGEQWAILLSGESGIGKSRLMDEFAFRKQITGRRVVRLEGSDLQPLLRHFCNAGEALSNQGRVGKNKSLWQMILESSDEAPDRELAVVCWHRFDRATTDQVRALKELLLRNPNLPIFWLLEVNEEPEELVSLSYSDNLIRRALAPFTEREATEFVGVLLHYPSGHQILSRNLSAFLGGNPSWLRIGLKKLVYLGQISFTKGRFNILSPSIEDKFRDVGEMLGVDLQQLRPAARSVAELLAVLGQPADIEDMWRLFELAPAAWSGVMKEIDNLSLLEVGDGQVGYRLPVLREMVYQSMGSENRAALHLWAGRWLEEKNSESQSLLSLSSIIHHYSIAIAFPALTRVVKQALDMVRDTPGGTPSLELLEAALELPPSVLSSEHRQHCHLILAENHVKGGRYADAVELYQRLLQDKSLRRHSNVPDIHLRLGQCLTLTGDCDAAKTHLKNAFELQKESAPSEAARALSPLAYLYYQEGDIERSQRIIEDYRELISEIPSESKRLSHLPALGRLLAYHGFLGESKLCYDDIVSRVKSPWESQLATDSHYTLIELAIKQGKWEEALRTVRTMERSRPPGASERNYWQLVYLRGMALISGGQIRSGVETIESIEPDIKLYVRPVEQCRIFLDLIRLDYYRGLYSQGIGRLRRVLSIARRAKLTRFIAIGFVWAVRFREMTGKPTEKLAREAEALMLRAKHPLSDFMCSYLLAEHFIDREEFNRAQRFIEIALKNVRRVDLDIPQVTLELMLELCRYDLINKNNNQGNLASLECSVAGISQSFIQGKCWALLARVALSSGKVGIANEYLKKSTSILQRAGTPYLVARSLEMYGMSCSRCGIEDGGASMLFQATRIYRGLGLPAEFSTSSSVVDTAKEGEILEAGKSPPLRDLSRVIAMLNAMTDPDKVTRELLEMAMEGVGAKRGLVIFRRDKSPGLSRRAAIQIGRSEEQAISHTIADLAFKRKEPVFSDNALADEFLGSLESVRLGAIHAVACVPILSQGEVEGVLYLDFGGSMGRFSETDRMHLRMLADLIGVALAQSQLISGLKEDVRSLRMTVDRQDGYGEIVGRSPAMREVFHSLSQVKDHDIPVLIIGETGTGKELIARTIHREGCRATRPFVALNCAAFPESLVESLLFGHVKGAFTGANSDHIGFFEQADGGAIFLDEVDESSWSMQGKLLRILQSGEFFRVGDPKVHRTDVRIIAAAKPTLMEKIETRAFREDLFFRLNVVQIPVPPLRERLEDIPLLVQHFISMYGGQFGKKVNSIQEAAESALLHFNWPGNVRQLENVIRHAVLFAVTGSHITLEHLPKEMGMMDSGRNGFFNRVSDFEKGMLREALAQNGGNASEVARQLRISRSALHRKLRKYNLDTDLDDAPAPRSDTTPP